MQAPSLLLPRPPFDLAPAQQAAFEALWEATPPGGLIAYDLPYLKWQFLSYLSDTRELVLHGSQRPDLDVIEPRQAADVRAYSNQRAIYATTDGIWALFFAILDRAGHPEMTLFNSCLRARIPPDRLSDPLYFFSTTHSALLQEPWCEGAVYVLERKGFEQEPPQRVQGLEIVFPHWIGAQPSRPVARLRVVPGDFPFLGQIHGHDNGRLQQAYRADPNGFPWPEALET